MNGQLAAVVTHNADDFKQVPGAIRAQVQDSARRLVAVNLALVEAVVCSVDDVGVSHAMLPR